MENRYALRGQSEAYARAREELLNAEISLRDQCDRVAELRRALPPGPELPDYVFQEGPADITSKDSGEFFETRLSELFAPDKDSLILMHFMFGPDWEKGCPMCSMWADGYNGVMRHLLQHANFAVTARAELGKLRAWAGARGWSNLRLLSTRYNSFTSDFSMESGEDQMGGVSVFRKDVDGKVRHCYTGGMLIAEGEKRGLELLSPVWHFLDLLSGGRKDWVAPNMD